MSAHGLGLGRVFNVIAACSGIHIPLTRASAVTFVTYEDDGSTILTFTQSKQGASEKALTQITTLHKGPGVGGTWTAVTQAAATTYDLADDTTNDTVVVTVRADQLDSANGFDSVELTVDGGIAMAFIHDLTEQRDPANLPTSLPA
jgi:hypothetical protein